MNTETKHTKMSQCQVLGRPRVKTWDDYRQGCMDTFGGGHRSDGHLEAFQHGMGTVFNLLQDEFPPAELFQAAPELLAFVEMIANGGLDSLIEGESHATIEAEARALLAKATGGAA